MQKFACMKFSRFFILFFLLFGIFIDRWFSGEISCPSEKWKKLTAEEIGWKIQACLDARDAWKEASITDFYCPSGDFTYADGRPLDKDTIPYHISVALLFSEIDKDALSYMCDLRELRKKDAVEWTEDLRKNLELTGPPESNPFAVRYRQVCNFSYIADRINTDNKKWVVSTETYPQSICQRLADKKALSWDIMGKILMWEGISKWAQNEKDEFMDKVKWKYTSIYDKYLRYKRIAERAIKWLTALAKETIR